MQEPEAVTVPSGVTLFESEMKQRIFWFFFKTNYHA